MDTSVSWHFHKENYKKYDSIFKELASTINIEYRQDKDYLCNLLTNFLNKNNYKIALHLDNQAASLISSNIKDTSLLKSEQTLYCYNNSDYSFLVFSERAIFLEPKLVTEFISRYEIFPDLERHVLDKNSYIYKFIREREHDGEYLWNISRRKDNYGIFSYKNINGQKTINKDFLIPNSLPETEYIKYEKQLNTPYLEYDTLVEEILIKAYLNGYEEFIQKLDEFISQSFFTFEVFENNDYLLPEAWDYLPRNVFFTTYENGCNKYIFFDTEAKYKKNISKSLYLAYVVFELERFLQFSEEKMYNIYAMLINKYKIGDFWNFAKRQRRIECDDIMYFNKKFGNCYQQVENYFNQNSKKNLCEIENKNSYKSSYKSKLKKILKKVLTPVRYPIRLTKKLYKYFYRFVKWC